MKKVIRMVMLIVSFAFVCNFHSSAQDTMRNVNRTTTAKDSASYSDTSFVNNSVRQVIVEYKLAELAQQNAEHPRIKATARQIMGSSREALHRLLALPGSKNIGGVEQKDLDAIAQAAKNQEPRSSENRRRRFIGNTATDSLGSGKTGSGNVQGEDTSMLNATKNDEQNANYSEQGEYLYSSESFRADLEVVNSAKGNEFERRWLEMMTKLVNTRVLRYNTAVEASKDDQVRGAALALLPKAKLDMEVIKRRMRNLGASESTDPNTQKAAGDDRNNRGTR